MPITQNYDVLLKKNENNIVYELYPITKVSNILVGNASTLDKTLKEQEKLNYTYNEALKKLNGIEDNAEVNQLTFSTIKVNNKKIFAKHKTDTLSFAEGRNISLDVDNNDNIIINANTNKIDLASSGQDGLMSKSDYIKLSNIEKNANNYTHPVSGVTEGAYGYMRVNKYGHIIEGIRKALPVELGGTGVTSYDELLKKLNIPIDTEVTEDSENAVTSKGIYNALKGKADLNHGLHVPSISDETENSLRFLGNDNKWRDIQKSSTANYGVVKLSNDYENASDNDILTPSQVRTGDENVKKYVDTKISDLVGTASENLDTIYELAEAVTDNKKLVDLMEKSITNKVDKEDGKGLSSNDFSDEDKSSITKSVNHINNKENPHNVTAKQVGLENVTNDKQVKGLSEGTTENNIVVFGEDGYTIKDGKYKVNANVPENAKFTDTTYEFKTEVDENSKPLLRLINNDGVKNDISVYGSGGTTVSRDAYGNIKIESPKSQTIPDASETTSGLLTAELYNKLINIEDNANNYVHPLTTATVGSYRKVTIDKYGHVISGDSSVIPVTEGGTGANNASDALKNLGIIVSNTEINQLSGVENNIQDQLDGKINSVKFTEHTNNKNNPHNVTAFQIGLDKVTNDTQVKGLSEGTTEDNIVVFGKDGYTIKDGGLNYEKILSSDDLSSEYKDINSNSSKVFSQVGAYNLYTELNNKFSNYSLTTHTHSIYSPTNHSHSNYSLTNHTHSQYSTTNHTHSSILDSENNKPITATYKKSELAYDSYDWLTVWNGYELRSASKNDFATSGHTHSQYITTTSFTSEYKATDAMSTTKVMTQAGVHDLYTVVQAVNNKFTNYSLTTHTHSIYSPTNHTHSNYSLTNHGHSQYITTTSFTSEYKATDATSTTKVMTQYSMHELYETCKYMNTKFNDYSLTNHSHSQYITTTSFTSEYNTSLTSNKLALSQLGAYNLYTELNNKFSNYSLITHTHSIYSPTNHSHSNYSLTNHTHSQYITTTSFTSEYKATDAMSTTKVMTQAGVHTLYTELSSKFNNYSLTNHTHSIYSPTNHSHSNYSLTNHSHSQYITTTSFTSEYKATNATSTTKVMTQAGVHDLYTVVQAVNNKFTNYSLTTHTHSIYSPTNHSHSNYSLTNHSHSQYITTTSFTSEYKATNATSTTKVMTQSGAYNLYTELNNKFSNYSLATHTHSIYSPTNHSHSNYSLTNHTHSQYSNTGHTHTSILDTNNSQTISASFSKATLAYNNYTYMAAWNGYELRAISKSDFAKASHGHNDIHYFKYINDSSAINKKLSITTTVYNVAYSATRYLRGLLRITGFRICNTSKTTADYYCGILEALTFTGPPSIMNLSTAPLTNLTWYPGFSTAPSNTGPGAVTFSLQFKMNSCSYIMIEYDHDTTNISIS